MAERIFRRSTHMPLMRVPSSSGSETVTYRDRARALFFLERNDIRIKITTFQLHTVTELDEFAAPTIAQRYYDNHEYWWVICLYNDIIDPTTELYAGKNIRIPDQRELERYLSQSLVSTNRIGEFVAV